MKKYVCGFMFDYAMHSVVLIRKNHPEWQAGLLNGVGGKLEDSETAHAAMVREFEEEAGYTRTGWQHYLVMEDEDKKEFQVHFFFCTGIMREVKSKEEEKIDIVDLADINLMRKDVVENLPWLIGLALDCCIDLRPKLTHVTYPRNHRDGILP